MKATCPKCSASYDIEVTIPIYKSGTIVCLQCSDIFDVQKIPNKGSYDVECKSRNEVEDRHEPEKVYIRQVNKSFLNRVYSYIFG